MKKTDIERILKQGSVRQKIKLYMTDIALVNVNPNELDFTIKEGELDIKGTSLLTSKERDLLWESIKEPKDVEYYNNLRMYNASFVLFKDRLTILNTQLKSLYVLILGMYRECEAKESSREIVEELIELYPDKKTKSLAKKTAKGWLNYLNVEKNILPGVISKPIKSANEIIKEAKDFIYLFKKILSTDLPLQPYKDWVKKQEVILIETINKIYDITTEIDGYTTDNYPQIIKYEEIGAKITEEDIEDFKNAGL